MIKSSESPKSAYGKFLPSKRNNAKSEVLSMPTTSASKVSPPDKVTVILEAFSTT